MKGDLRNVLRRLRKHISLKLGVITGLTIYFSMTLPGVIFRIPNIDVVANIVAPFLAGLLSDDEGWFPAGFLTLFIPSIVYGVVIIPVVGEALHTVLKFFSLIIFLPIFAVFAGIFGGLISMFGRIIGEEYFNLIK